MGPNLYQAYNQIESPEPKPEVDPFMALIMKLLTPQPATQPAGGGLASTIAALRNDPVGDFNKATSLPSYAPGSMSPFNTGFFNNQTGAQKSAYPSNPVVAAQATPRINYQDFLNRPFVASPGVKLPARTPKSADSFWSSLLRG